MEGYECVSVDSGCPTSTEERAATGDERERGSVRDLLPHEVGRLGEDMAVSFLERRGWRVLERNWRSRFGEADIIAQDVNDEGDEQSIVLIEVKTRLALGDEGDIMPEVAVDAQKQDRYRMIALCYIVEHPQIHYARFDVIAVSIVGEGKARLRHLYGAFSESN